MGGCGDDSNPTSLANGQAANATANDSGAQSGEFSAQIDQAVSDPPAIDPLAGWVIYRHALGATLRHPADWKTQEVMLGVQLFPADAVMDEEVVLVMGGQAQPGQDLMDQKTAQYMDMLMGQGFPWMRRSDPPSPITSGRGQAVRFDYAGTTHRGRSDRASVYVLLQDDIVLSLTLLGERSRVDARTPTVETIFSTLGMNPQTAGGSDDLGQSNEAGSADTDDPRLIGVFRGEALASSPGVYVNTQLVYVLNADGTFYSGAQSHFNQSQRDHNGRLKWAITDQTDNNVLQGTWSARGGVLTVAWSNGTRSVFAYNFEPDGNLVMRDPVSRELINFYVRVQ